MTTLKDMTLPKEKKPKPGELGVPGEYKPPKYPYGLRLHLETPQVKKLKADDLEPNQAVRVVAQATVVSKEISEQQGGEPRLSITLQIEKMALMNVSDDKVSAEERIKGWRTKK